MAMAVRIEGIDELIRGAGLGAREIADVWRAILRGPFGDDFLREMKARASDNTRTGYTLSKMRVQDDGADGVQIGVPSSERSTHPSSPRASAYSVGVWLESGTRMHYIPTKVTPYNRLSFGGTVVSRVVHPGTKATRPAFRTLQVYRRDFATLFERELDRRLAARMGMR